MERSPAVEAILVVEERQEKVVVMEGRREVDGLVVGAGTVVATMGDKRVEAVVKGIPAGEATEVKKNPLTAV